MKKDFYQADRLHLKAPAYKAWADAMEPLLKEVLKQKCRSGSAAASGRSISS